MHFLLVLNHFCLALYVSARDHLGLLVTYGRFICISFYLTLINKVSYLRILTTFISFVTSSKGSIVAEFQLLYRKGVAAEKAMADLKEKIGDGNLGSLRVDPASLEQTFPGTQGIFPL